MKKPINSIATSSKTHFEESEEEAISSSEEEKYDDTIDSDEVGIFYYNLKFFPQFSIEYLLCFLFSGRVVGGRDRA